MQKQISKAEQIVRDPTKLPTLPTIYSQLREAIDHPHGSLTDVSRIISQDTSLSARVLRIVNSAYYGMPSRVETIPHAISILGTQPLCELVLATSVISIFNDIPKDLVDLKSFWKHSIGCGLVAKALANHRGEADVERYFMMGLLHDIGRLVLFDKCSEETREALIHSRKNGCLLLKSEKQIMDTDHAEVGRALLTFWKMSPRYQEAVGLHHEPLESIRFPVETAAVHVADMVTNALEMGSSGEVLVPPLEPAAWALLKLDADHLDELLDTVMEQLEEAEEIFL